jgi:hypothetical protein
VSRFSASVPPLIRQFSERNPQALHKGAFHGILSKLAGFPRLLRMIFVEIISSAIQCLFQQLFRAFSGWKKGEKQAERRICGKPHFDGLNHS